MHHPESFAEDMRGQNETLTVHKWVLHAGKSTHAYNILYIYIEFSHLALFRDHIIDHGAT